MKLPGTPIRKYDHDGEDQDFAKWMLKMVDESPDRLAMIEVPPTESDDELDALEDATRRAFDLAKLDRPNLVIRTIPGRNVVTGERRILLELHEHRWVGGGCVNGCGEERPVDDPHPEE